MPMSISPMKMMSGAIRGKALPSRRGFLKIAAAAATVARVDASHGLMPKSSLRISVAAAKAHSRPATMPIAIKRPASFRMSW